MARKESSYDSCVCGREKRKESKTCLVCRLDGELVNTADVRAHKAAVKRAWRARTGGK